MVPTSVDTVIQWIHSARVWGEKAGLDNMEVLLDALGRPQDRLRMVHVAGTNGKGSTCAMVERALRASGLRTGLYTSPYLVDYRERIRLNGAPATDDELMLPGMRLYWATVSLMEKRGLKPTAFELGTVLALHVFARHHVDVAVIEAGLGGRLDPTNVISPLACAIASIGLDHMETLGDTIEQIAFEKAGIIKPGAPVAVQDQPPQVEALIEARAAGLGAPIVWARDIPVWDARADVLGTSFQADVPGLGAMALRIDLPGEHQLANARLALALLSILKDRGVAVTRQGVMDGLAATRWPGRLEWVGDDILLDGAHNPQGAAALADYLGKYCAGRRLVLLTAMLIGKQPEACAAALAPHVEMVVTTQVDEQRALDAQALLGVYRDAGARGVAIEGIGEALDFARRQGATVVVAGSLYLVGAVRMLLELGA